jgi:phosphate starvation-inducible PhoH-like protein
MRGRSFHDAICIFDEAQNASLLQLKLFLTRFGENSKIIVTGDPNQSDIGGKVALVEVIRKLKGTEGIGIFEFDSSSIVRHKLVGKIIEKLES